jgi:hypothetical protein
MHAQNISAKLKMSTLARAHVSRTRSSPHPLIDRSAIVFKKSQSSASIPTVATIAKSAATCRPQDKMTKEEVERRKREEAWEAKVREEERTLRKEERGWDSEKVMGCERGWRCLLRGLGK